MKTTSLLRALLALALISGLASVALAQDVMDSVDDGADAPQLEATYDLCSSPVAFEYSEWRFRVGFKAPCCALCFTPSKEAIACTVCHTVYDKLFKRRNACYSSETTKAMP